MGDGRDLEGEEGVGLDQIMSVKLDDVVVEEEDNQPRNKLPLNGVSFCIVQL